MENEMETTVVSSGFIVSAVHVLSPVPALHLSSSSRVWVC